MLPYDWLDLESMKIRRVKFEVNPFDNRGNVLIEFNEGRVYKYRDVPAKFVEGLVHSGSPGGYFEKHIRGAYNAEPVK